MYSIKIAQSKEHTDEGTFIKGEKLFKRKFFPFSYIETVESLRYDCLKYQISWRFKGQYYWYYTTKIEVDIDNNLISY